MLGVNHTLATPSVDVLDDPNRKTLPFFASAKSCLVTEKPETLMRVRNQERTNACATFVTTAVIYGAQVRHSRHAVPGSPQEILDYGGIFQRPKEVKAKTGPYLLHSRIPYSYRLTFNYATKIGISPASVYKWDGNCKFRGWDGSKWDGVVEYDGRVIERAEKVFIKKKSELIPPSKVDDILKHQPLTGMITITDEFRNWKSEEIYRGGGFAWHDGENPLKHAVTIVGHGVEGKDAYFICQNSYGLGWGYRGYFKVLRSLITHKYIAELLDVEEPGKEDGGGEESGEEGDASCGQGLKRKFGEESGEKGDASCGQGLKRKFEDV